MSWHAHAPHTWTGDNAADFEVVYLGEYEGELVELAPFHYYSTENPWADAIEWRIEYAHRPQEHRPPAPTPAPRAPARSRPWTIHLTLTRPPHAPPQRLNRLEVFSV